jgi:hypothetical protein
MTAVEVVGMTEGVGITDPRRTADGPRGARRSMPLSSSGLCAWPPTVRHRGLHIAAPWSESGGGPAKQGHDALRSHG